MRRALVGLLSAFLLMTPSPSRATEGPSLRALVDMAAARAGVAPDLVSAIIWVESRGWPWTLNVRGIPLWPASLEEARGILARLPHDDVDIGFMQVNWRTWGPALERAGIGKADLLDPWVNLVVGSQILRWMTDEEPGWGGVGRYHSATPWRKSRYAWAVARTWQAIQPAFQAAGPSASEIR